MRAWPIDRAWPWIAAAIAAGLVLLIHDDFGPTWDEGIQDRYGRLCLRYFASGGADGGHAELEDLRIYGPLVEMLLVGMRGGGEADFTLRHLGLGLLAVLTIPALARFCRPWGAALGACAVLILWSMPRFLGHAFNNSKDLPFLVGVCFTMATLLQLLLDARLGRARVLAFGLALGLTLSVRPGGAPLLALLCGCGLLLARALRVGALASGLGSLRRAWLRLTGAAALAWMVMVLPWPWAHASPLLHPIEAMTQAMRFQRSYEVLFEGQTLESHLLPWYYLPKYLLLVTPPAYLVLALLALRPFALAWRGRSQPERALLSALALCWLLVPIALFTLVRPNVYDGIRHFLFLLPALSVLAALGLIELVELVRARVPAPGSAAAATLLVLLAALPAALHSAHLHPYQGSAFNRFAGGVSGAADRYELDYWATGLKGALEWIDGQGTRAGDTRLRVLLGVPNPYPLDGARFHASDRLELVPITELPRLAEARSGVDYYVGPRRYGMHRMFERAPLAHAEARDGVTLVVVRDLGGAVPGKRPGSAP